MQISFEALERALAPIEDIGKGEVTFDVGTTPMTLRILLPEEEAEVQKYATQAVEAAGESGGGGNAMELLERFKLAMLSYAIIEINGHDLRGVAFLDTDEKLPNGVVVQLPKAQALRKLLGRMSAPVRLLMFRKYTELLAKVESQAEAAIKFEPADLDAEIVRLGLRLEQLKTAKEQEKATAESEVAKIAKTIVEGQTKPVEQEPVEEAPSPQIMPVQKSAPVPVQQAEPPVRRSSIPGAPVRPVAPPVTAQPKAADYVAGMDVPDSFVNPDDFDSMEAAVESENRRLVQARRAASLGQVQEEVPSVLTTVRRRPPHLDAADAAESLETQYLGRTADGVDTFRMSATEEVTKPRAVVPESPKTSPVVNPRFQPPRKP